MGWFVFHSIIREAVASVDNVEVIILREALLGFYIILVSNVQLILRILICHNFA